MVMVTSTTKLEGHPTPVLSWVDVATGSLGQGLPDGVGIALAAKYLEHQPYRVWVLCGDSELAEGSIWEALDKAAYYKRSNLIAIFPPAEQLSSGELRILRYLPTNLSRPEIAGELSISPSTVSTHPQHLRQAPGPGPLFGRAACPGPSPASDRTDELASGHRIPVMRTHLAARHDDRVDPAPAPYLIRIRGHLGATLLSAFPALAPRQHGADTELTGLLGRSALYGVLSEIEALGLDLLEVRRLEPDRKSAEPGHPCGS